MKTNKADSFAREVKSHDYDRYLAAGWAPPAKREGLYIIAAFNSELARISEQVSEPMLGHIRLAWWREALEEMVDGKSPRAHPLVSAMARLHAETPQIIRHAFDMIEARAVNLDPSVLATEQDWVQYLDKTAGALHHAWAELLDPQAASAEHDAIRQQARQYATLGLVRGLPYATKANYRFSQERLNAHEFKCEKSNERLINFVQALVESSIGASVAKLTYPTLKPLQAMHVLSNVDKKNIIKAGYDPYFIKKSRTARVLSVLKM